MEAKITTDGDDDKALSERLKPYDEVQPVVSAGGTVVRRFQLHSTSVAEYDEESKHFVKKIALASKKSFIAERMVFQLGNLQEEVIVIRSIYSLSFMSLPLELRLMIYGLVYQDEKHVGIELVRKGCKAVNFCQKHHLAILGVNKEIRAEALQELFHVRTFHFPDEDTFAALLRRSPTHVTHIKAIKLYSFYNATKAMAGRMKLCTHLTNVCIKLLVGGNDSRDRMADRIANMLEKWLIPDGRGTTINLERLTALRLDFVQDDDASNYPWSVFKKLTSIKGGNNGISEKETARMNREQDQEEKRLKESVKKILTYD